MKSLKIKRTKLVEGLYRYSNGIKSIRINKTSGFWRVETNEIVETYAWFKDAEKRVKEFLNY
jgi:hypothetical protein